MATPYPFPDGFDRRPRRVHTRGSRAWDPGKGRVIRTTLNVVGVGAFLAAPIAAVALWLLLTDPVLASEVAERGSMVPVMKSMVFAFGRAIATVLAYL